MVQQTFVLRMNICGKNRQLLVAAKRCGTLKDILEYERKINNTVNPNLFNNSI